MVRRLIVNRPQQPHTLLQRVIEAHRQKLNTITETEQAEDFINDGSNPTTLNGSNPSSSIIDE